MLRTFKNNSIANSLNVPPEIHEEDFLFNFLDKYGKNPQEEYFLSARESAKKIDQLIKGNIKPFGISSIDPNNFSLLDFASGFGMVNRHFRVVIPSASVEACDIHPAATSFSKDYLGIPCYLSNTDPSKVEINKKFDVVVALSFLSHLPHQSWSKWLELLFSLVKEGGLLIFTTHGPTSGISINENLINKGIDFYFYPDSEQYDLDKNSYGSSYSHPRYAMEVINNIPNMHLSEYKMGKWWGGNQDAYVLAKKTKSMQMISYSKRSSF